MRKVFLSVLITLLFPPFKLNPKGIPERIVSLSPSITRELCDLRVGGKIVGCTTYCRLDKNIKAKRIGTVINVNIEELLKLKPDIVFATPLLDSRLVKRIRALGFNIVIFREPRNFQEICEQFLTLAKLVGKSELAKKIVIKIRKEVEEIREKTKNLKKVKVFVEIGSKPLFTAGKETFIDELISFAGGENIAGQEISGIYSLEKVLEKDPDVIVIVTMGLSGKEKEMWMKFKNLKAVKTGRVYVVDSYKVCSPTPVTFLESLKIFTRIFHPELKLQ